MSELSDEDRAKLIVALEPFFVKLGRLAESLADSLKVFAEELHDIYDEAIESLEREAEG